MQRSNESRDAAGLILDVAWEHLAETVGDERGTRWDETTA